MRCGVALATHQSDALPFNAAWHHMAMSWDVVLLVDDAKFCDGLGPAPQLRCDPMPGDVGNVCGIALPNCS